MKQTLLVTLAPTPDQHAALLRTLEAFNAAGNAIAAVVAFRERCANKLALQRLVYYDIRAQCALSSQMTIRATSKVREASKRDQKKQPSLRPHGALVYDERILRFPRLDRASLLTLDGRVEAPFRFGAYATGMLARTRGQADLRYRNDPFCNDPFFLASTVDTPAPTPTDTAEFLGVDPGIIHIIQLATTSDGEFLNASAGPKHRHANQVRARFSCFRQKLQQKGTKSAKRLLRTRSGREQRFGKDVNHCLSKAIVSTAQGTGHGMVLEDLTHIRSRVNGAQRQRRVLHTWSFFQLRAFIAYKAALAGVRVIYVTPAYTSQTCSACGQCEKANRTSQSKFLCRSCGFSAHADVNAAVNIRQSARRRAAVNRPDAAALAG